VAAAAVFVLLRLCASLFDFRAARAQLCDDIYIFIEREVGRFYASDAGGAVLRLKNELAEAQHKQTEALTAALKQLTAALGDNATALNNAMLDTTKDINEKIAEAIDEKLVRMADDFAAASAAWQKALTQATAVQNTMNQSAAAIDKAGGKLQSAAELLASHLQGHSNALSEQLVALVRAVEAVKDAQASVTKQGEYIERNQQTLEGSLRAYETALQNLSQSLGESLGAFVNVHAQNSAQAVNDALRNNIERIMQLAQRGGGGA
jgi:chromosome segregation ATPase